jgi:hypothetical protein
LSNHKRPKCCGMAMRTMTVARKTHKDEPRIAGEPTREIVGYVCDSCHRTYMALGWRPEPKPDAKPIEAPEKKAKSGYCLHIFFLERVESGKDTKTRICSIIKKIRKLKDASAAVKEHFPECELGNPKKVKGTSYWEASNPPVIWLKIHKDAEPCPPGWSKDTHIMTKKELEEGEN